MNKEQVQPEKKQRDGKRYGRSEALPEIPSLCAPYRTRQASNPEIETAADMKRLRRAKRNRIQADRSRVGIAVSLAALLFRAAREQKAYR